MKRITTKAISICIGIAFILGISLFGFVTINAKVVEAKDSTIILGDLKPQEVYNENGIVVTFTGVQQDDYDYDILFRAENKTNTNYVIQLRNESINGWMIDSICSSDVQAGKKINDNISFWKDDLLENGITEIENFEFNFHIFNDDDWLDYFESPAITVQFDKHTHNYSQVKITVNPTCTQKGEKTYECPADGAKRIEEIPATGHRSIIDAAVEPTCTKPGKTEGSHCSVCGKKLTKQTTIPAKGHSWDKGIITTKPTITATGVKTYTCKNCKKTRVEKIAKLPKKDNPLKIKVAKAAYKSAKLKKAVTFSIGASKGKGKVSFTLDKNAKKAGIIVNAKGKVLIPKNCKKGTFKIAVKAAGNKIYKAGTKVVTIYVK